MEQPFIILIAVVAFVAVLTALSIRSRQKKEAERIRRELKELWGSPAEAVFNAEYSEAMKRSYLGERSRACGDGLEAPAESSCATIPFEIDEITWNDLDMERLYRRVAATKSSCGDVVLYDRLRHPCLAEEPLQEYDLLATYFADNEAVRNEVLTALCEVGRPSDRTIADELHEVKTVDPIGRTPYAVLAVLTILDLIFLFIWPLAAVLVFIGLTIFNIVLALRMKERIGPAIRGFQAALKLIKAAEDMTKSRDDGAETPGGQQPMKMYKERMAKALSELRLFKAGSSLVTGRDRVSDSLGEAILRYINLLLHLDLLKFDQMLKTFNEHEAAVFSLHDDLGYLDAAASTASYRESIKTWCRPAFDEATTIDVRGLCHPLLKDPVPATTTLSGGMLVTGSNASGKSTFLKEMALASLMAQTIATVSAEEYRAPFVRLMTSMALTDNLSGGESYYIVEIRSIRRILEAIESGGPVLAVVDEVLKGTNTIERIAASSEILKAMTKPNSLILAATHDRELTEILGDLYTNKHFEETVVGEDIQFTYELLDGPASTRNAIHLLEAEGYDAVIADGARQAAEHFEETGEWLSQVAVQSN